MREHYLVLRKSRTHRPPGLFSNEVTSDNKRIHTPPPSPPVVFYPPLLSSTGSSISGIALHGRGRGRKSFIIFDLFKLAKVREAL